jgi:uncharacterized protein (DUF2132 family)
MDNPQPRNPLHGITLETMLTRLVEHHGWERLAGFVKIRCFQVDPSVKSSLAFLRKTPWARMKVEEFYLKYQGNPWNRPEGAPTPSPSARSGRQCTRPGSSTKPTD